MPFLQPIIKGEEGWGWRVRARKDPIYSSGKLKKFNENDGFTTALPKLSSPWGKFQGIGKQQQQQQQQQHQQQQQQQQDWKYLSD